MHNTSATAAALPPRLSRTPFESAAPSLMDMEYQPLPIDPAGKRPAEWSGYFVKGVRRWQSLKISDGQIAAWMRDQRHASFGVGVRHSETFIGLDLDTDDPELIAKIAEYLNKLNGVPVRRVGRRGFAAYFRCAADLPKGKLSSAGHVIEFPGQSVLPPSIHPGTGRPYTWITSDTLEDTPLGALPLLTSADIEALNAILREHTGEPVVVQKPRPSGAGGGWRGNGRDWIADAARANLPAWVEDLNLPRWERKPGGYQAVATWRASGTGRPLEDRELNLHIDTMIYDYGDQRGYSPVSLVMAALGLDKPDAESWLAARVVDKSQLVSEAVFACLSDEDGEPWPSAKLRAARLAAVNDNTNRVRWKSPARIPLAEATAKLKATMTEVESEWSARFADTDRAAMLEFQAGQIEEYCYWGGLNDILLLPQCTDEGAALLNEAAAIRAADNSARLLKVEPGLGKTTEAIAAAARAVKAGRNVAFSVPNHDLAEQVAQDFAKHGVDARVLKGADQPGMCARPDDREVVEANGLSLESTLCVQWQTMPDGNVVKTPKCPHWDTCPFAQQFEARSNAWIVTHAHLFQGRKIKDQPDALIIDEAIVTAAVGNDEDGGHLERKGWSLDEIEAPPAPHEWRTASWLKQSGQVPADVADVWFLISKALGASLTETGDVSMHQRFALARARLDETGVDRAAISIASRYSGDQVEIISRVDADCHPEELGRRAGQAGALLADHRKRLSLLKVIRQMLADDIANSGRVWLTVLDNRAQVHVEPLKVINGMWTDGASVLHLDATMYPKRALEAVLNRACHDPAEFSVEWPDDIEVVVVQGAPVRKSLLVKNGKPGQKFETINDHVNLIGADAGGQTLYVPRKKVLDLLEPGALHPNIEAVSPGMLVGINRFSDAKAIVITASGDAGALAFERMAGIISGEMPTPVPVPPIKNGGFDKPVAPRVLLDQEAADGQLFPVMVPKYRDRLVYDLWRTNVMGVIEQCAARMRPIRRMGKPGRIVIFSDSPIPIPVTLVLQWRDVDLGYSSRWMLDGTGVFSSYEAQWRRIGGQPSPWTTLRGIENAYCDRADERGIRGAIEALVAGDNPLFAKPSAVRYRVEGGRGDRLFVWHGDSVTDPQATIHEVEGAAEILESLPTLTTGHNPSNSHSNYMRDERVMSRSQSSILLASARLAFLAEPTRYPSPEAAKKHFQRHPVRCPTDWQTIKVIPAELRKPQEVHFDPAVVTLDNLPALLERLIGRPCKLKT